MADINEAEVTATVRAELNELVEKQLNSKNVEISIEPGSSKGDNYIGIVYGVSTKAINSNKENGIISSICNNNKPTESKLIIKVAPLNVARRKLFMSRPFFLREILMYDEVLPYFHKFQEDKGIIPEENGFFEYPVCYKTIATDMSEALFFADLRYQQFTMFDRMKDITADHVHLVMRTLGKFHALSFALRDQRPDKLQEYSTLTENMVRETDENMKAYAKSIVDLALNTLDKEKDVELIDKCNAITAQELMVVAKQCVNGKSAEPYAVVCHGDCWNNNTLFRNDKNGKPTEIRFLDWQISRYASPVTDVLYYIFCCTTKKLRDQHYDDFLRTYHESLSSMISRLGSDPTKLFPFDVMKDQLKKFGVWGLVMAVLLLPLLTTPGETSPDLDEIAESIDGGEQLDADVHKQDNAVFNQRMRDVIIDIVRLDYIL